MNQGALELERIPLPLPQSHVCSPPPQPGGGCVEGSDSVVPRRKYLQVSPVDSRWFD